MNLSWALIMTLLGSGLTERLTPVVRIGSGPIQGKSVRFEDSNVYHFLGIPYAQPPISKLRFLRPMRHAKWTKTLRTTDYGKPCVQRSLSIRMHMTSEDCLFLNIFVNRETFEKNRSKANSTKRPVMVWIHGGGLQMGSGNDGYQGIPIVPMHDIILVTFNYRLNAFGFIHFGGAEPRIEGNMGFWDQNLALRWVRHNIHKFGGDRDSITIFGESAGGSSVEAHIISPASKGLFHRAIIQSAAFYRPAEDLNHVQANSNKLLNRTFCWGTSDILTCMQRLDARTLIDKQEDGLRRFGWIFGDEFLPTMPEEAFTDQTYDDSVDILMGVEKDEFTFFSMFIDPKTFNPILRQPLTHSHAVELLSLMFTNESIDYFSKIYLETQANQSSDYLTGQLLKAFADFVYVCPTYMFGVNFMRNSPKAGRVYAYYHTQKPLHSPLPLCSKSAWMGVCHTSDIPYVFGAPFLKPRHYTRNDARLSHEMMKIWTTFAKSGEMPQIGGQTWNTLQEDAKKGLDFSAMIMNINSLGSIDTERLHFCVNQWPHFLKHATLNLFSIFGNV